MAQRKTKQKKDKKVLDKKVKEEVKEVKKVTATETGEVKEAKVKEETVILGHFKPRFFIIAGILIVLAIVSALYFTNSLTVYKSGNQTSCTSNTQCQSGSYCSDYGACIKSVCGDGVCLPPENQSSCPIDCGCGSGYILNKHTDQCQSPVNVSTQIITTYIDNYLSENNVTGHITSISDSYYGNITVKQAIVNCQTNSTSSPCKIIFYFNQTGNVINVIRTT